MASSSKDGLEPEKHGTSESLAASVMTCVASRWLRIGASLEIPPESAPNASGDLDLRQ